jgi:hypothetical protein
MNCVAAARPYATVRAHENYLAAFANQYGCCGNVPWCPGPVQYWLYAHIFSFGVPLSTVHRVRDGTQPRMMENT